MIEHLGKVQLVFSLKSIRKQIAAKINGCKRSGYLITYIFIIFILRLNVYGFIVVVFLFYKEGLVPILISTAQ